MRGKGVGLVTHFVKALLARGVPIRLDTSGRRPDGRRRPRHRRSDGRRLGDRRAQGRRARDRRLRMERRADARTSIRSPGWQPLSPPSSTGDGLIMGAEIGAAIRRIQNNLNLMLGFHLVPDEPGREPIQCMAGISEMCSPHTIVVNKAGRRFADESYFQSVVPALRKFDTLKHGYANLPCFLIFDEQFAASYALAHLPVGSEVPASVARADTISELAGKLGIDAGGLDQTVARFNGFAAAGHDDDFQRGALRWRLADRSERETAQSEPRPARPAAVLRPRTASEPRHHIGRLAGRCQRPGVAPAPASDSGTVCVGRGGGAHRARRRLSGRTQSRLGDDVQPAGRAAHEAAVVTAPAGQCPWRAVPRSRPPWR